MPSRPRHRGLVAVLDVPSLKFRNFGGRMTSEIQVRDADDGSRNGRRTVGLPRVRGTKETCTAALLNPSRCLLGGVGGLAGSFFPSAFSPRSRDNRSFSTCSLVLSMWQKGHDNARPFTDKSRLAAKVMRVSRGLRTTFYGLNLPLPDHSIVPVSSPESGQSKWAWDNLSSGQSSVSKKVS